MRPGVGHGLSDDLPPTARWVGVQDRRDLVAVGFTGLIDSLYRLLRNSRTVSSNPYAFTNVIGICSCPGRVIWHIPC